MKDYIVTLPDAYYNNYIRQNPELIRCKDCIYYRQEIDLCDEPHSIAHDVVHEDDYCSKAVRKEENDGQTDN